MLTAADLEKRRTKLTASDVPSIFGHNPYKTAYDLFIEKTLPVEASAAGEAAAIGNDLEDAMLSWGARQVGIDPENLDRQHWAVAPNGIMAATIDATARYAVVGGLRVRPTVAFEAKTVGMLSPSEDFDMWGEEGTDNVPFKVLYQCVAQMIACPTLERVHVPVLLGYGRGRRLYTIERDAEFCAAVETESLAWWDRHVVKGIAPNPDGPAPSMDTVKRVRRDALKCVDVDPALITRWLEAKERAKAAEEAKDDAFALLLAAMGDAQAAACPLGRFEFKTESAGVRLDADRLKREMPNVFEQFARATTRQMPRWKPVKAEKAVPA